MGHQAVFQWKKTVFVLASLILSAFVRPQHAVLHCNHVREKDGIWAVLAMLSILASKQTPGLGIDSCAF